jgi:hypothetical protein
MVENIMVFDCDGHNSESVAEMVPFWMRSIARSRFVRCATGRAYLRVWTRFIIRAIRL